MARRQNKSASNAPFEPPDDVQDSPVSTESVRAPDAVQAPPAGDPVETPSLFRDVGPLGGDALRGRTAINVADLNVKDLLDLRAQVDARLPALNIAEMNLESEVILHYYMAKELAREAATDDQVPRNQQAQVMNSCAAILKTLADAQTALYTAERVKCVEAAMERAFSGESEAIKKRFFDRYAAGLRELAASKDTKNQSFIKEKR
jgi:hypothetical protein